MGKPKIRFKGYTDEWEQRKLGDILEDMYNGQTPSRNRSEYWNGKISWLSSGELNRGIVSRSIETITTKGKESANLRLVPKGTFVMAITGLEAAGTRGNCAILGFDTTLNQSCMALFPKEDLLTPNFLFQWYRKVGEEYGINYTQGTKQQSYNAELIKILPISLPSVKEQEKIAGYLENLDALITLHQRKCNETKKLKKYMLQKMFPQNGEKVPEVRFSGFTDDWEQRKFGEITELKSASRVHKDEWTSNGVPFYRSSDVMAAINGTENEKAYISEELYEKLSKVSGKLEEGDILVTGGGSVGNPYIVPDNKPLYTKDADLLWIKNKGKFHPYFLYEFFFSPTFRNYLGSISHVGTIAHYTITQLSDTPICLPSFEEQKEVGEYFQSLDNLITLHQQKCDELRDVKKYMLQNMFI